ncbi:MAG: bifunctional [glutamate--ammonia ligase]-adenylyl-L-tyrosine phosphorylase/[glutamate--ammonia-ligase] adenylyltransferase [Candidatus Alcyoniella australis]|nr:bifunctional [glutamate--ammonia ligase]-adenylyl-L-tyrosine phosphorylase/[glutamate--ammonia-ligase] adenylyltransferase [Candidatus Alcyoniella australis]
MSEILGPAGWPLPARVAAVAACSGSVDSQAAALGFMRLAELRPQPVDEAAMPDLALIFGASPFLGELLLSDDELLDALCRGGLNAALPDARQIDARLAGCGDAEQLRLVRSRLLFTIALSDLARRADTPRVLLALSDLADCVCQRAWELACEGLDVQRFDNDEGQGGWAFCTLAMGKLGARELNFSSDIDLVFVHSGEPAGGADDRVAGGHELAAAVARRMIKLMTAPGRGGALYRVDLRLRPMGRSGDVVTSLRAAEVYYESWGETWERQALLRARPCAGNIELGYELLELLRPFVFRRYLDHQSLEAVARIKERMEAELGAAARQGDDVKLSPGGIRELEFIVQSLQLIHGGRDKSLRTTSTLDALEAATRSGHIEADRAQRLRDSYLFLRELENRLQMHGNLQTQLLPHDQRRMAALARLMGIAQTDDIRAAQQLRQRYDEIRHGVREIYEQVVPARATRSSTHSMPLGGPEWAARKGTIQRLDEAGFADPKAAYAALISIREDPSEPERSATRELFARLAPELVARAAQTPDPDAALMRMERFVRARGNRSSLFKRLWSRQREIELLLRALGGSAYMAGILIAHPELSSQVLRPDAVLLPRGLKAARSSVDAFLEGTRDPMERAAELARSRRANELAIGLRDMLQAADVRRICSELSDLAQACCEVCLDLARKRVSARHDVEPGDLGGFAVLALGSLGPRELTFNADLDLLFCFQDVEYDDQGIRQRTALTRLAETLIVLLAGSRTAGPIYRIDARLRPDGGQGAIAMPASATANYFRTRAAPFERQALLRMRLLAGDAAVAEPLLRARDELLFSGPAARDDLQQCAQIRERYFSQIDGPPQLELKFGPGGLLDVEFGVQLLALAHGYDHQGLRSGATLTIINAAARAGLIQSKSAAALRLGWLTLKAVENKLRLTYERPRSTMPQPGTAEAAFLGRLLDWPEPGPFYEYLDRVRRDVETAYLELLSGLGIEIERGDR